MGRLIDWAMDRSRAVLLLLFCVILAGSVAYVAIPRESQPDVAIPNIYVSMVHEGISSSDAERLLVRPMEKELRSIEGVKEMKSVASEGHASVSLEFDAGFDSAQALLDVREKVDLAKVKLPSGGEEPEVHEVNVALFPVLSMSLSGPIPERQLLRLARDLKDDIEALPEVLEVEIGGDREEVLDVIVDPLILETYNIDFLQVIRSISNNNKLVAAGAIDNGDGRMVVKVPGVVEDIDDMLALPIKTVNDTVVTFGDVASIRRTYKDAQGFARLNGQSSINLEVKKRVGENIIATISKVKQIVAEKEGFWPSTLSLDYTLDQSDQINTMIGDLQNNVISAVIMVMIVIIGALGFRSSLLVGMAIPASFLAGILVIYMIGYTLNIVVLFSLILVVGMLVDGAIVVTELANRYADNGLTPKQAFAMASKRMSWPIIASTATTLAVFVPLVGWPGIVGEFMKYLPITVMICLIASLFVALVFLPVLGAAISKKAPSRNESAETALVDDTEQAEAHGKGWYSKTLALGLRHPTKVFGLTIMAIIISYMSYFTFGLGTEFFPDTEPDSAKVLVHARGDLSIYEKDKLLRHVEERLIGMPELKSVSAQSYNQAPNQLAEDVVGTVQFQFIDWKWRRPASKILDEMRQKTADIAGVKLEFRKQEDGPSAGKPIQLQVSGISQENIYHAVDMIRAEMDKTDGLKDIEDNRPLPGIDWQVTVDRRAAARYGADINLIGSAIQMMTRGYKVTDFRPDDAEEEVDIMIRFPQSERNLDQLSNFSIQTPSGSVPLSNFVELKPVAKTGTIKRVDAKRVITIQADIKEGFLASERLQTLQSKLKNESFPADIRITEKGDSEDQKETGVFLSQAFFISVFAMLMILLMQFNSFYQSLLVLSAIIFSTAGVLLGLLVAQQAFGVVMVGLGIIALAGIVVNNNIVLIDTYNAMRKQGHSAYHTALITGELRLRPVLLTAGTTVLGLIPMVLSMNLDFINREAAFGAPSTQWWTQLASAIAGGLAFATVLTLFLTPCLLVLGANVSSWWNNRRSVKTA
ncbi:efflux RND transporter permease subunit [Parashewanella curva]|uniref:Efflux RND transporter permease subunit n=1 Tax=Parashewanella curva TaxID=2338552 RepID=A0A3L8PZ77_9GAMM|nr:efflux RND transporter permease subunit [Parashewanella curva]RLV59392.1 efflux RND transporter permease subunit [Parashewanella curva]